MKQALFIKSKERNTLLSKPNFPVRSRFSRNMPSKAGFQGQRQLLILYLYLFMLTNKWRKGKEEPDQTACGPLRLGYMQWLWALKLLRTLQCPSSACSASVFGCFFYHRAQEWFGLEGILLIISVDGQGYLPQSKVLLRIIWKNQTWLTHRSDISASP